MRVLKLIFAFTTAFLTAFHASAEEKPMRPDYPYVYHLVQARLWEPVVENNGTYYPPTYEADGFTHATANPAALMNVANHFYKGVDGTWYCLRMTEESLEATGVKTIWEGTAPVGAIEPEFEGSDDELFPHILGGIKPAAVLEVIPVERAANGSFLAVSGVTD
ncbi:DUF952 domain-containing protein [Pseudohaliea rubra]|uniref:DUF952 domain-containing protein n=1 Tax=Pseudohaliea rubra DSM 19751 TaxID=1265313 RepID=A0A095X226_9GAMM|nr:DUF952 domain-containing protein [Pseudohaliea rubra]KGE04939.1 hypothetical protein HRUBRA_00412 [Pseudohaliea rubra DSM 19751]